MGRNREWVVEAGFSGKDLEQILNTMESNGWTIFQILQVSQGSGETLNSFDVVAWREKEDSN
jgi:hypothetical protein